MESNQHELLARATDEEVRQFANALEPLLERLGRSADHHESVEGTVTVKFPEDSSRKVTFENYYEEEIEYYSIRMAERTPIDALFDQDVAASLLGEMYLGSNRPEHLAQLAESGENVNTERGLVEGYLEREKKLTVNIGQYVVMAMTSMDLNVLDLWGFPMDTHIGYTAFERLVSDDIVVDDMNMLFTAGEVFSDARYFEDELSKVTRVELLIAFDALRGVGFIDPDAKAYDHAPADIELPSFFSIGNSRDDEEDS